jgi:hypothetical protein
VQGHHLSGCIMPESKAPPVAIVDFRAEQYSPDGKAIVVSFTTAESAERRSYALPVQSLYGFIADLQKLPAANQTAQSATAPSASHPPPPVSSPASPVPTHVEVTVPRKWMARAMPERNVVVMVFNPQTEKQTAYALPPEAVREMAAALVKQADKLPKIVGRKIVRG